MTKTCKSCGSELGLVARLGGQSLCAVCGKREREVRRAGEDEARRKRGDARGEYKALLGELTASPGQAASLVPQLKTLAETAAFGERESRSLQTTAFRAVAGQMLEDDILSEGEENTLNGISEALGITPARFHNEFTDLFYQLVVARMNDGRLPVLDNAHIITQKGEVVHAETEAELMKEVTLREFRGGYRGFSFRVAKGVTYRTGWGRGHSVVVGTNLVAEDSGLLALTSKRAVFVGSRKTVELPYSKLINLGIFSDGVQFHMGNRTQAPLFKVENGDVIGATVNAAVQRLS